MPSNTVRRFREIVLWPLELASANSPDSGNRPRNLAALTASGQWREVESPFAGDPGRFTEQIYFEFVAFLPYVQRLLWGERDPSGRLGESPVRVLERNDVARVRIVLAPESPPLELEVSQVRLFLFSDIDVAILLLEITGEDLPLPVAEELLLRFGRAYPASWQADGRAGRCPELVEWRGQAGEILARSDYENRSRFLTTVARSRAPCFATHWEWLLRPMAPVYAEDPAAVRYRQLEYYRMPLLGYLGFDDPAELNRADFARLGLVTGPIQDGALPCSASSLAEFERDFCYDRFWAPNERHAWTNTRLICTGHTFLMIGKHSEPFFTDPETGLLGQFRREYLLLAVLAHFHKAALLMMSDRLVVALNQLNITDVDSIKRFKRSIRMALQTFLRFTHRYWFHEVSTQDQAKILFRMWSRHLDTERLYAEVREEIQDMSDYLNSDSLRRQANTVVRLTVVTTLGLVGTIATGVLGMNLFSSAYEPWFMKLFYFLLVLIPTVLLTLYTVSRSKPLADLLEDLSERQSHRG